MSSSSFSTSLLVLSFGLLLNIISATDPLFYYCPNSVNFTSNSLYEKNLDKLLGDLYFKTPPTGFGRGSSGGQYQDSSFGLSLCRGDISAEDCKTCVIDSSSAIHNLCPYNKVASIWYDNCLLKYSNNDFLGMIDTEVAFYSWSPNTVNDSVSFNLETKDLMSQLSEKASVDPKKFATGEYEVGGSQKLYGMVQCTRDVSGDDCKKCLDSEVSALPSCCDGKQGGRVVGGSCSIRYETYPFFNS